MVVNLVNSPNTHEPKKNMICPLSFFGKFISQKKTPFFRDAHNTGFYILSQWHYHRILPESLTTDHLLDILTDYHAIFHWNWPDPKN